MREMNIDWNTKYERTMNHTYMVLSKCDFFAIDQEGQEEKEDYRIRMLLENQIPGLLPVTHHRQNGENCFYYEINSLQSMSQMYEKEEIDAEALEILLHGCVRVFEKLEEYLLDGSQILLQPEYIYIHPDTKEPFFTYYPACDTNVIDVRQAFVSFVDYLLARLDHTQEDTVMLGYQVYRYTKNPNFVLSEITKILSEHAQKTAYKKSSNKNRTERRGNINDYNSVSRLQMNGDRIYETTADQKSKDGYEDRNKDKYEDDSIWELVTEDTVLEQKSHDKKVLKDNMKKYDKDKENQKQTKNNGMIRNEIVSELLQVGKKEFIGVIVSISLTAVSCLALFVIKVLGLISIPYLYEMYLCGILAMALVATAMFAYSLHKKRQEWKEIQNLQGRENVRIPVEHRSVCMIK